MPLKHCAVVEKMSAVVALFSVVIRIEIGLFNCNISVYVDFDSFCAHAANGVLTEALGGESEKVRAGV